eukprot:13975182-Alexandrium_andersonii.AAC.1
MLPLEHRFSLLQLRIKPHLSSERPELPNRRVCRPNGGNQQKPRCTELGLREGGRSRNTSRGVQALDGAFH